MMVCSLEQRLSRFPRFKFSPTLLRVALVLISVFWFKALTRCDLRSDRFCDSRSDTPDDSLFWKYQQRPTAFMRSGQSSVGLPAQTNL